MTGLKINSLKMEFVVAHSMLTWSMQEWSLGPVESGKSITVIMGAYMENNMEIHGSLFFPCYFPCIELCFLMGLF